MNVRQEIRSSGSNEGIWGVGGGVKAGVLISLAAFFLFFLSTIGIRQTIADDCGCDACHATVQHAPGWAGCASCHGFPPATASHLKHFEDAGNILGNYQEYGALGIAKDAYPDSTAPSYLMGCGNCHPIDKARHRNGTVDVELYNPAADPLSLKARNPSTAAYTQGGTVFYDDKNLPYTAGSCSNVYCHSYNESTTTGPVTTPWLLNSVPPNTVTTRYYKTPTWGESLSCSGCHENPPTTNYLTNDGGSGDSHSWLNNYGEADLHGWNMGSMWPVSCRTCHNDTVTTASPWTYGSVSKFGQTWYDVAIYGNIPINNYAKHVNGTVDVSFDKATPLVYFDHAPLSLVNAAFDAPTKTCSNVACHREQTTVTWGTPYRYWDSIECSRCHTSYY